MRRSSSYAAIALAALTFAAAAAASLLHQSHNLDERIKSIALNGPPAESILEGGDNLMVVHS